MLKNNNSLNDVRHVHFIGIGGIGISALARMMVHMGKTVSGTNDNRSPETLDGLRDKGVEIKIGTTKDLVPDNVDMFVYSVAWENRGPEVLKEARSRNVKVLNYFEALGEATKQYKTVAVSGTHGKTTTTAMIYQVLKDANNRPNVIVGSLLSESGSNFVAGNNENFIVEACEYKRHFLNLSPQIGAITNIEEDHLDYYKDLADIQNAFSSFAQSIPEDGTLICNKNDKNVIPILERLKCAVVDYNDYLVDEKINLKIPGWHNIQNARVAMAVADIFNIDLKIAKERLEQFAGTWRRFEFKGETENGAKVYNDYAHHPSEIKAVLSSARQMLQQDSKVFAIFEPHMFSRTEALMAEFATSFSEADNIFITPIYPAREEPIVGIDHHKLASKINAYNKNVQSLGLNESVALVKREAKSGDIILLLGAGDIYQEAEKFLK